MSIKNVIKQYLLKMHDNETLIHEENGIMMSIIKRKSLMFSWFEIWENGSKTADDQTADDVVNYIFG